jgi:putative cobalt transporter subunit CbtB
MILRVLRNEYQDTNPFRMCFLSLVNLRLTQGIIGHCALLNGELLMLIDRALCVLSEGDEMYQILSHFLNPIASLSSEKLIEVVLLFSVAVLGVFSLYLVGFDQGYLLAIFQGHGALTQNLLHELVHDARHVAAFPCH